MARAKKNEPQIMVVETVEPEYVVKAHSYVEITYPKAVEYLSTGYGFSKRDFVKLLPRDEALEFARAIQEASKEII